MPRFKTPAKKHLGQNFLINEHIIDKMISRANPGVDDFILEIGPGLGALTQKLINAGATVTAIEKDPSLIPQLKQAITENTFRVIEGDFLTFDPSQIPHITKVMGNIPYNISTPIVERLILHRGLFPEAFLTTQLEFAKRLSASPGTKDFGSMSCFIQYYADIKILFPVSARCFRPAPKVTSSFIHIQFREPKVKADDEKYLFRMIRTAFQQRRKKIENSLAGITHRAELEAILDEVGIKRGSRADQISLEDYIALSNILTKRR